MTNKEARNLLNNSKLKGNNAYSIMLNAALDMAIKALEQESILDKIKTEIKLLSNANPSYWHSGDMVEREEVFDIIDKYRESEV